MDRRLFWTESGRSSGESIAISSLDGPFGQGGYNLSQFLKDEVVRFRKRVGAK
jgi:hypothetical protein